MDEKHQAFIFDLDGTIYLGDELMPGADKVLKELRSNNIKIRFVTNNPRFSREIYANKLNDLGVYANKNEIITSAWLAAEYFRKSSNHGEILLVGEDQIHSELEDAGVNLVKTETPDTVLVSFDTTLTYEKLQQAYYSLKKGAKFIATNPDAVCPTPGGGLLDTGAIIAALEKTADRKVDNIIGKPSPLLGQLLVEDLEVPAEKCVVVGDRLNTDVSLGNNAGMTSIWVNNKNEEVISDKYFPDHIINSINDLSYTIKEKLLV